MFACGQKENIGSYKWEKIDYVNVTNFHTDSIATSLFGFTEWNNHIFFTDTQKTRNKHFGCFEINGDSLIMVDYFWRFGRGHNESIRATYYQYDDYFYIKNYIDIEQAREVYKVDKIDDLMDSEKYSKLAVPASNDIIDIVPIDDRELLVTLSGYKTKELFGILDSDNGMLTELSLKFPGISDSEVKASIISTVYNGMIAKRYGSPHYVYSTRDGNCVFIFKIENGKVKDFKEIFNIYPKYEISPDGENASFTREGLMGYKPTASANYFYLLHREDEKPGGNEIFVFDWNGKPIRKIVLDRNVYLIDVSRDDSIIYGATVGEDDIEFVYAKI